MTDVEKWEMWRNANAEIKHNMGFHKRIMWYEGADRRKAFLDGLEMGRKEHNCTMGFCDLPKEIEKLSQMLEIAINDTIRKGNQCFYCKDNYTKDICDNCTKENRINVMKLYRAELEKRVENEK